MNKAEFVKKLSNACFISQKQCLEILNNTFNLICKTLKEGDSICFKGFGKFYVVRKKERIIKSFSSNSLCLLSESNIAKFKISKQLKNIIR